MQGIEAVLELPWPCPALTQPSSFETADRPILMPAQSDDRFRVRAAGLLRMRARGTAESRSLCSYEMVAALIRATLAADQVTNVLE
jgi:hypothetical protein